jgi:hypothetical protein
MAFHEVWDAPMKSPASEQVAAGFGGCVVVAHHGIEHRFNRISYPWTVGQVEQINRTIKDAIVKRFQYDRHYQLRRNLGERICT